MRPRLGLSIASRSVCLVELTRKWQGRRCCRLGQYAIPEGLLQLSPGKPNITDVKDFSNCLQSLMQGIKSPQPVALSLPDLCARTAVFEFSSFPQKETERDAILRWRFQQDLNLSTEKARVAYRLYRPPKASRRAQSNSSSVAQVLATVIQQDIVEQYEQACLTAGLLPASVSLASLDVFDFYRSTVQKVIEETSRHKYHSIPESVFLYLTEWGFCFIALRDGYPIFIRVKGLRLPRIETQDHHADRTQVEPSFADQSLDTESVEAALPTDSFPISKGDVEDSDSPDGNLAVTNELVATLQFYFESTEFSDWENKPLTLFFAEGIEHGKSLLPSVRHVEGRLRSSMVNPPHLNILSLPNNVASLSSQMKDRANSNHQLALPAYASVVVA